MAKGRRVKSKCGKLFPNTGMRTSRIVFLQVHHNQTSQTLPNAAANKDGGETNDYGADLISRWCIAGEWGHLTTYNFSIRVRLILRCERCSWD